MAVGDIKAPHNAKKAICLLAARTTTNSPPSAATDGVPNYPDDTSNTAIATNIVAPSGVCFTAKPAREAVLVVASSAGSGSMDVTLRLWGYLAAAAAWVPVGPGADTTKGILNNGAAIGETIANGIRHSEPLYLSGAFDRLYLEVTAINGTSTAIDAWIVVPRTVAY